MENNVESIICKNLIALRKSRNLKQSELSEAIGYSDKTISRWENGTSVPDISTLVKLSKFYNISLEDLIQENATEKYVEKEKKKNHEEIINFYSLLALGVLTVWVVAVLVYIGLIMIRQTYFWQVFILAIPFSCLVMYKNTRKNYNLRWFNFLVLTLSIGGAISFFYLAFLSYNFWQLFILFIPLEGISAISSLPLRRYNKEKKNKKEPQPE